MTTTAKQDDNTSMAAAIQHDSKPIIHTRNHIAYDNKVSCLCVFIGIGVMVGLLYHVDAIRFKLVQNSVNYGPCVSVRHIKAYMLGIIGVRCRFVLDVVVLDVCCVLCCVCVCCVCVVCVVCVWCVCVVCCCLFV